jgi:cytochrome c biogenesis protein CcmG/thiol:disulfide interchange protein DsbE
MENNEREQLALWVDERLTALQGGRDWQPNTAEALARLRERRDARGGRRIRTWTAVTAVAVLGAMALPGTRVLAERCVGACSEAGIRIWQSLTGSGSIPARASLVDKNRMAPDFTLHDVSGNAVKLSDLRGKVVLLNFWATWCPPCKIEIPWFIEFQQTYGERDFAVLGVSLDEDGWKSVEPFVKASKVNYRVMVDNGDVAALYGGVTSLPATFVVDRSGRIAAAHTGLVSKSDYRTEIEMLLSK